MKNKIITLLRENTWLNGGNLFVSHHGWGNGYVVIFKGHTMYGKHYDEVPVDVHGGLTFSKYANEINWPEITEEMKDGWVFGFDTAHYSDDMERWPKEAVERETENLKSQFVELSPDFPVYPFKFS
jgi:hypothetical protein